MASTALRVSVGLVADFVVESAGDLVDEILPPSLLVEDRWLLQRLAITIQIVGWKLGQKTPMPLASPSEEVALYLIASEACDQLSMAEDAGRISHDERSSAMEEIRVLAASLEKTFPLAACLEEYRDELPTFDVSHSADLWVTHTPDGGEPPPGALAGWEERLDIGLIPDDASSLEASPDDEPEDEDERDEATSDVVDHDFLESIASDAEWELHVYIDEEGVVGEGVQLRASAGPIVLTLEPPGPVKAIWTFRIDNHRKNPTIIGVGDLTTAAVIDLVPQAFEIWVLASTRDLAEYLLAAADVPIGSDESSDERDADIAAGMRLLSELEQAEAHSAHWAEQADSRYGGRVLYGFRPDDEIVKEPAEIDGAAVLRCTSGMGFSTRVLYAPDDRHPWRWSDEGAVDEYGENLSVATALERAGDEHRVWVIEQTSFALGETLRELRSLSSGRDLDATTLAELARASEHARKLSQGLIDASF